MTAPDLILTGGTVLTQDPEAPEAEAVAFRDGRVLAVGQAQAIEALADGRTRVEHRPGSLILPGFVDCHTHAARLGELHFRADLSEVASRQAAIEVLQQRAERTPPGGWVIGWNWDETGWLEAEPLTPDDMAQVSGQHPVMARRVDGHLAVVNEAALEALELPAGTPGLEQVGDEPTGRLTEDAADLAWEGCAPAYETCVKGLRIETRRLASLGITSIADTAGPRDIRLLTRGAREGFFLQRSGLYVREELLDHLEALGLSRLEGEACALLGVKTYTDGSVGARTAAISQPYEDEATKGMLLREAKQVEALARRVEGLGLQLKAHAIGDRAIQAVLDGVQAAKVPGTSRPRLEHAEMVTEAQLEQMAELGVIACMQPNFIGNWQGPGGLYDQALGAERRRAMNPLADVLDHGVPLGLSSDGMPYGPLYGIACATQHPEPSQRLTVEQAIHGYTRGAAYALGCEEARGVLKEGALADAVVLAEDVRSAAEITTVGVELTVIGGRVVHETG